MPNNAATKYGGASSAPEAIHRLLAALGALPLEDRNLAGYTALDIGLRRRSYSLTDNATKDSLATGALPLAECGFFDLLKATTS